MAAEAKPLKKSSPKWVELPAVAIAFSGGRELLRGCCLLPCSRLGPRHVDGPRLVKTRAKAPKSGAALWLSPGGTALYLGAAGGLGGEGGGGHSESGSLR